MRASFFLLAFLIGCGGRVIDGRHVEANPDGSTPDSIATDGALLDTAVFDSAVDTSIELDTDIDSGPPVCDTPVSGFSCPTVTTKGSKSCTDKQIKAFMDACFGTGGDGTACSNAQKMYASCGKCVLESFITPGGYLDVGACMKKVKPASTCAGTTNCLYACWSEACGSCDPSGGSTEYSDCIMRQSEPTGSCWEFGAKDYDSCSSDPDFAVCIPNSTDALLPFYRGACRDGGDWTKADTPDGTL